MYISYIFLRCALPLSLISPKVACWFSRQWIPASQMWNSRDFFNVVIYKHRQNCIVKMKTNLCSSSTFSSAQDICRRYIFPVVFKILHPIASRGLWQYLLQLLRCGERSSRVEPELSDLEQFTTGVTGQIFSFSTVKMWCGVEVHQRQYIEVVTDPHSLKIISRDSVLFPKNEDFAREFYYIGYVGLEWQETVILILQLSTQEDLSSPLLAD